MDNDKTKNYKSRYDREHYKSLNCKVDFEFAEKVESFCKQMNMTKSEFLKKCIEYGLTHDIF